MRAIENSPATVGGLRPAGCCQERGAEPVGFRLAGCADGLQNLGGIVWRHPHRQDDFGQPFFRQPGTAHFLFHTNAHFRLRKYLTNCRTFVYISQVSKFEAELFSEKCPHVSGKVSNQRHPARTGAGKERLDMKARSLKIEKTGDFFKGKIIPRIRIAGQWLEQAGFKPGERVEVRFEQPGILTLRSLEQAKEVAL